MFVQADYCELCETARPCACDVEIDAQDKTPYERERYERELEEP